MFAEEVMGRDSWSIVAAATSLAVLCFVVSCGGTTGATGAQGPQGEVGATGPTGPTGATGATGAPGANGDAGAPGQDAPTTGNLSITVNQGTGVDGGIAGPMTGVTVTAETTTGGPIDTTGSSVLVVTAVTDATGNALLTLPFGVFDLTFVKTGYTSPAPVQVGVVALQQVSISVTLNEAASSSPSLTLVAAGTNIGYGQTVAVTAAATSPLGNALTYTWTNATAYGLGTVTGSDTTGSITTPTLLAATARQADPAQNGGWNLGNFVSGYSIPNTFGKLPVLQDTTGAVTASVKVTDGFGLSATASVIVAAASYQNTTHAAAVGTRVFLNAGATPASGTTWSLTVPTGSTSTLDDTTSRFPSFIPDLAGPYVAKLGSNSLTVYAGTWRGVITVPGSTVTTTNNGTVPYVVDGTCVLCHKPAGLAIDEFTPWIGTGHAIHLTYALNGVPPYSSGQACLGCHSVGYDPGNSNGHAGGMSQVAADAGWTYPKTIQPTNWASTPASVAALANIQCESCHGPQGNGTGPSGMTAAHMMTDVGGAHQPFQSPRISYAAEVCGTCHAAGSSHHIYSEWATADSTHPSGLYDGGLGHSNLAAAQSEGLTSFDGGPGVVAYQLNSSCGRCHTAQGFTTFLANLNAGNVGPLSPAQQAGGQLDPNNVQPQTCVACHDPHQNTVDPVTGTSRYQLRVWGDVPLLPSGFAAADMGSGAVCITCHNSRNGAYNVNPITNATTTAYLHEDSDWIGSNPGSSNPALVAANYPNLGASFKSLGGPHEANQGDVFVGRNAYFLTNQTPVISPHAAVKDTCVGCHMQNQPQTYVSHGSTVHATHLFAITDQSESTLCASCHAAGTTNVDGAALQASVEAGLAKIITNIGSAVVARVNDATGAYTAPTGYGAWHDTGTIIIAAKGISDQTPGCTPATDPSCGLISSAPVTIVTGPSSDPGANPLLSAVATPLGRSGISVVFTFATPVTITFGTVVNSLSTFTVVSLASVGDAAASPLFAPNGNMFKANWNYSLIEQDESKGVHNPPFVSAVLSATANPWGNPNATPPQPGGLWY
jgi:hypothetical protein